MTPLKSDDPKSIKGWQLLGRLGAGGTGLVYLANDDNGRTAAVKVLRSELSDNALVRERLKREAQILTRVKGGRTAIIYEVDAECETPFIAMAPKNHLANLKQRGFKTFSQWWNEDYDYYEGLPRINEIKKVVATIMAWPQEKMQQVLIEMEEILNHNRTLYLETTYE